MSENVVTLNVGGTKFITTKETLLSDGDTYFNVFFHFQSNLNNDNTEEKEIFIDKDPNNFTIILKHLRGYNVYSQIKELNYSEKELLAEDVIFYNIASMFKYFPLFSLANVPNRKVVASDGTHLYIYDTVGKRVIHEMKNEYNVTFIEKLGKH